MNALYKTILRLIGGVIITSITLQPYSWLAFAQEQPNLSSVDILRLEEADSGVRVHFAPLAEGMTITARVDQEGKGDFLTIQSALAQIKSGVIAVSSGTYQEHDLVVPAGVIVRGGYDSRTWERSDQMTTIVGTPTSTSIALKSGSGIQHIVLQQAKTAVRVANGPATISQVVISNSQVAVELSPYAHVRIAYSDFVRNDVVIDGEVNSKVFALGNIFQNNTAIASQALDQSSFIQDSTFFPQKNSLQNIRDQNNNVATNTPLPQAQWQFPSDSNGIDQSFDFSRLNDATVQTLSGPTLENTNGINAIFLYYQLNTGDELRIVDRSNFSKVVFTSADYPREYRGWIALAESKKLSLLLDTNGDNNLPLQVGVRSVARIPSLDYRGPTDRGALSTNPDTGLFYRTHIDTQPKALSTEEKRKLDEIDRPIILAGEEWITGKDIDSTNKETSAFYKGSVNKVLLNKSNNGLSLAWDNFSQRAKTDTDTRSFVLLRDYLELSHPAILPDTSCGKETSCPFSVTGIKDFMPLKTYSLRSEEQSTHNERGLYNSEGWNVPAGSSGKLVIDFPTKVSQFTVSWSLQPYVTNPGSIAHILGFFSSQAATEKLNVIDLFLTPDGNVEVQALDNQGQRITHRTSGISWERGRKYRMVLNVEKEKVFLTRDDGVTIWQQNASFEDIDQVIAGASQIDQLALPEVISDFVLWQHSDAIRTFSKTESTQISGSLANEEASIAGSITFDGSTICATNSLIANEGSANFFTISGTRTNSTCALSLRSPLVATAETSVPISDLSGQLVLIWQWNSLAAQGTIGLYNSTGVVVATLPVFNSNIITQAFGPRNLNLQSSNRLGTVNIQYRLLPRATTQNLIRMVGVERYEILYGDNEGAVKNGTAANTAVTVEELQASSNPQKLIANLNPGSRYFFAARAILENGGTTETTHSRDLFLSGNANQSTLEAGSQAGTDLPTTLALANIQDYQIAYAQQNTSNAAANTDGGSVLPGHLGEALSLNNIGTGQNSFTAWSLGRDLPMSSNKNPKHIYTVPGEYIVSQIRTLSDGNILKQFVLVAVGAQSSASPKIVAETWTASANNPAANWNNKSIGKKVPAIIGINEPIYLLGKATDVAGSSDTTYTWNYQVDWGDGTTDTSEGVRNAFHQTRLVNRTKEETPLSHRYARAGIYTIVSQVTDERNNMGAFENTVIVSGPEVYPQRITSMVGIGRILTISGGSPPYTVRLIDGSEQTLDLKQKTFTLPIVEAGTIMIKDRFENITTVEVTLTNDPKTNFQEVYLASDRSLAATPNSLKTDEVVSFEGKSEEQLELKTRSLVFNFGDTLPSYLTRDLPDLDSVVTFGTEAMVRTSPFLTMGVYSAVLTSIDEKGEENKKTFALDIGKARLGTQSNAGVITGSVSPGLHSIPNSIAIWERGRVPVKLATLTPNDDGRFIYIVPETQKPDGVVSIVMNDQKGISTDFPKNIRYSLKDRPSELFGLLESNGNSPLFTNTKKLATNVLSPTFFGVDKLGQQKSIRIASEDPQDYPIIKNDETNWIIESKAILTEGEHEFSVLDSEKKVLQKYDFIVDRTPPAKPTVSFASWSQLQGKIEPFGYIGVVAQGQTNEEKYIQADAQGDFHLDFLYSSDRYILAAADEAGNVSPLVQISQNEWQEQSTISLWQKVRPYLWWSLLVALAATGITYARRVKI